MLERSTPVRKQESTHRERLPSTPSLCVAQPLLTPRGRLVPATRSSVISMLEGPEAVLKAHEADLAADWFHLEIEDWVPYVLEDMKPDPSEIGWWLWWLFQRAPGATGQECLVGYVGFKGPPSPGGNVEVTYGIAPSRRRMGLVTEAVGALVQWAFRNSQVRRVLATVVPDNAASLAVLRRQGFKRLEDESDEDELVLCLERGR